MDVGAPSNFARMLNLYGHANGLDPLSPATHAGMKELITGYAYDDATTERAVKEVESKFGYVIDPHGAVGYLALNEWQKDNPNTRGVILETAHPSKFKPDVERILGHEIEVPQRLAEMEDREKVATQMGADYEPVKEWLKAKYL
jgi:threonine synthase